MNPTPATDHPAALTETLARMGLSDLLEGYVAPERVRRWGFLSLERFAAEHGYSFERRDGNVYGALRLAPTVAAPAPRMRVITRSDVAAVHGSRRAA
jgi:hypothetical protein